MGKSFGVTGRSVSTPGVRDKPSDTEGVTDPGYKSGAGIWHAIMQQPSDLDEMGLKRLARYLGVRPRLIWLF